MTLFMLYHVLYKRQRTPKGHSKIDNTEKLTTYSTQDQEKQNKTQHNMCWTPLYVNKHK